MIKIPKRKKSIKSNWIKRVKSQRSNSTHKLFKNYSNRSKKVKIDKNFYFTSKCFIPKIWLNKLKKR